jgi:hypothetical protein
MDILDFEELISDMLDVTDEQREDDGFLQDEFYKKFNIEFDAAYEFTKGLLLHTVPVQAGLSKKYHHTFVSKDRPIILMKVQADEIFNESGE